MPEQKDEGTIDRSLVDTLAGVGAKAIPGEGGEEHLVNSLTEFLTFLDERGVIPDKVLDTDD